MRREQWKRGEELVRGRREEGIMNNEQGGGSNGREGEELGRN
jgi:hypothetical protein